MPDHPFSKLRGVGRVERAAGSGRKRTRSGARLGALAQPSTNEAILSEKYRRLTRSHLGRLPELFRTLTGLECSVCWAPTWPHRWRDRDLPSHSWVCRQLVAGRATVLARCQSCIAQHLATTLQSGHDGHRFTCFMGVRNFWLPIIVRHWPVGLAFVQALTLSAAGPAMPARRLRAVRMAASGAATRVPRAACRSAKRMGRSEFDRATELLRLVFGHVETSALADLRKADLTQAQQALQELQTVATRLRGELNGLVPAINKTPPTVQPECRTERVVHAALECIHEHYSQPLTLAQCAEKIGLNATYLSALFSRQVGVPFKTYLTEVRIEKARELLSDPARNVSEVAFAVGYSSENRFRAAFKGITSLSPRAWRETLRMPPAPTPPST